MGRTCAKSLSSITTTEVLPTATWYRSRTRYFAPSAILISNGIPSLMAIWIWSRVIHPLTEHAGTLDNSQAQPGPNDQDHRPGATDVRPATGALSPGSVHPLGRRSFPSPALA